MIGLDTNVLVRFLVQDEPRQAARADSLMAQLSPTSPGYLSTVVLVETYWVLRSAYRQKPEPSSTSSGSSWATRASSRRTGPSSFAH